MNLSKRDKKHKMNVIEKILPLVWNSYQHMYDVRKNNLNNIRNVLLLSISFLPIISLVFFDYFKDGIFLIPVSIMLLSLLILIKTFFIENPNIPWLEFKETLTSINSGSFYTELFLTLKALENDTYLEFIEAGKYIRTSIQLVILSLFILMLCITYKYFPNPISSVVILICTFVYLEFLHNKLIYKYQENKKRYSDELKKWLNDNGKGFKV